MAPPAWRSAGTFAGAQGDITPGLPTGWQQDDIFLMIVEVESNQSVSAPSGWANVTNSPASATTAPRIYVMWKRAGASESAPTISDTGDHQLAIIHAFSGCTTTGNPWNVTASSSESTADTSGSCPSVTTTVADTMVVLCATAWASSSYSGWTNSSLGSLTERSDNGSSAGFGGSIGVATGTKTSTGSTGTTFVTLSNAMQKAFITVALEPLDNATNATPGSSSATGTAYDAAGQEGVLPAAEAVSVTATANSATILTSFVRATPAVVATAYSATVSIPANSPTAGAVTATAAVSEAYPRGADVEATFVVEVPMRRKSVAVFADDRRPYI